MPRNRSARTAVLGASVRRPAAGRLSSSLRSALKRRILLGLLLLAAIVLITISFRENGDGPLSRAQDSAADALHPLTVAGDRVAQPFRDAYAWFEGLTSAKDEADRLREENEKLRQELIQNRIAAKENAELRALLDFRGGARFPDDFGGLAAAVVARPREAFSRSLVVSVGRKDGVQVDDPVVTGDGLVGIVTRVSERASRVTLLLDDQSAVSAEDVDTGASGIVRHRRTPRSTLVLDRVPKENVVKVGDLIVTAGWRSDRLASLYPRGIAIGEVTSVGRSDTDLFTQVQLRPFVDFDSIDAVLVLTRKDEALP